MKILNSTERKLPRREREVMELLYQLGQADVAEVHAAQNDAPSLAATRMLLQRLHKKELLQVERVGSKYVYQPVAPAGKAGLAALKKLINTFFSGSSAHVVHALIDEDELSAQELEDLEALVAQARARRGERNQAQRGEK